MSVCNSLNPPFLLLLPQTWGEAGVLLMPKALWPQPGFSGDTVSGLVAAMELSDPIFYLKRSWQALPKASKGT